MITTADLVELTDIPAGTLASWQHRGALRPEQPGKWNMAECFAVALLARALGRNRGLDEASRDALAQVEAIGGLIRAIAGGHGAGATKVILFDAHLADGDRWARVLTTDADFERLIGAAMRRGIRRLEVDDISELYVAILEAFQAARAEPRQRAKVLA